MPYLVAIDYTHVEERSTYHMLLLLFVGSAAASFKVLVTVAQEDSTNQTAATSFKVLVTVAQEDSTNQTDAASFKVLVTVAQGTPPTKQLQPPLNLITISQERKVHKPNSRTERTFPNDKNCQHNKHASMSIMRFNGTNYFLPFFVLFSFTESRTCIATFGIFWY